MIRRTLQLLVIAAVLLLLCGFPGCPSPVPPPPPPPTPALIITTVGLPVAEVGAPYVAQFRATGGVPPYIWSATGLPPGLVMNAAGQISGVPASAGIWMVMVRVTDATAHHVLAELRLNTQPASLRPVGLVLANYQQQPKPCLGKPGAPIKDASGVPISGCGGGEIQGGLVINIQSSAPTVSGVTPSSGTTSGGTALTISGTNFRAGATVSLGAAACLSVVVVNSNQITCVTPANTAGVVSVTVTNADGTAAVLASAYSFTTGGTVSGGNSGSPLLSNNTSACGGSPLQSYCTAVFPGMQDVVDVGVNTPLFNPPTGNVSKLDIHTLLPAGTHPCVHLMGWFTTPNSGDHGQTKYNSNDVNTVAAQMTDVESRGFECGIIDWYSSLSTGIDGFSQKVRDNLAASGKLKFAIMEDQGAVFHSNDHNCSSTDHACIISAWETDLCYMNATYFGSSAYLNIDPSTKAWITSGHPVVFTFPPSSGWNSTDMTTVRTFAQNLGSNCASVGHGLNYGPVQIINQDSAGFTNPPYSGAFSWVGTSPYSATNQYLIDGGNGTYHESFYTNCVNHPGQLCFGSAKKGFNDNGASWGQDRVVDQECAETWTKTLGKAVNTVSQLALQGVTWNDYEEGTEIETGIDNCYHVNTISLTGGNILGWGAGSSNNTYAPISGGAPTGPQVHGWTVWACDNASPANCTDVADKVASVLSLDLSTVCIQAGTWNMYVQLVGQPSVFNHISPNSVSFAASGANCGNAAAAPVPNAFFGISVNNYSGQFPLSGGIQIYTLGKEPGTSIQFIEPSCDGGTNPSNTCYNWGGMDGYINFAQAHGFTVAYDLDGMPGWMCTSHNANGNCNAMPSPTSYITNFATALATRYRGKIKYYETYNELGSFEFNDSCANTVYFHNLVYNAIKAADPNAIVGAPNMSNAVYQPECTAPTNVYTGGGTMMDSALAMQNFLQTQDPTGHLPKADMLGVHFYGTRSFTGCSSGCYTLPSYACDQNNKLDCASLKVLNLYNAYRAVMNNNGMRGHALLATEGGWGADVEPAGYCGAGVVNTGCLTATQQPEYVGRWLVLLASTWSDGAGVLPSWYAYDVNWGTLNGTSGMNAQAATAYGQMEGWLQGAIFDTQCTATLSTAVLCSFTSGGGAQSQIVFNNNNGATVSYTTPSWATHQTPLLGTQTSITGGAVITVGDNPVLIQ